MDSRSLGLPFGLSASRSSRASAAGSAFSTTTTAGYGRETVASAASGYGRETAARHDRFSRLSSYKSDVDVKSPGLLSSTSRDYGSSWKLRLSLAVSGRSNHGASAERALAGSHRLADSDGRGVRSGPLSAVDDSENKRAKMAYSSRWLCPRTTTTSSSSSSSSAASLAGTLRSGNAIRGEPPESSRRTRHFLPRPSAAIETPEPFRRPGYFLPRPSASREAETRSGRERPTRSQDIASSLYPTERLTSAYAQGARPKDSSYLSCARDSAATSASSAYRQSDDKIRPSSRFPKASYGRLSPETTSSTRRAETSPPPLRRDTNGRRFLSTFLSSRHGRDSPPGDRRADVEAAPFGRRRLLATGGGDSTPPPERREERPPGFTRRLLRRRDDPEPGVVERKDADDDEERRGAAAPEPRPPGLERWSEEDESPPPPTTRENLVDLMLRRRATRLEKTAVDKSPVCAVDSQQEKLRLIKERLLQEDSDEDEGDLCRICQAGELSVAGSAPSNPLIQPCRCSGSLQYVHRDCIKRWLCSKIVSGTSLEGVVHCELCKAELRLDVDNFDVRQLHRTRAQLDYDNFVSSGLYLVVLLEFCEQRFSDVLDAAGLFDLSRILPEQMDNLENSQLEGDDGRPFIDFSDLDDDLNDED
ncbi:E3 ubiquitin-protein ligase MARCHF7 [Stigmatopora nigra]